MFSKLNLNTKLILAVLSALILALGSFALLRYCGNQLISSHYIQFYAEQSRWVSGQLITETYSGNLDLSDETARQRWLDEHSTETGVALYDEQGWYVASTSLNIIEKLYPEYLDSWTQENVYIHQLVEEFPLPTLDGIWILVLYGYIPKVVLHTALILETLLSIGLFSLFFHLFTRKKMNDFLCLELAIQRMRCGDLEQPIVISGGDQLGSLAENLDQLRQTLRDQLLIEEETRKSNVELITSMSHDLRTPLTVLTGYLEIVNSHKCKTPQQQEKYLHLAEEKARQIRELSDRLFECSLVFGADELLVPQRVNGRDFLEKLAEERGPELSSEGFSLETSWDDAPRDSWFLEINPQAMRRVWDNLFSNVVKYGDPAHPLSISASFHESNLKLLVSNQICRRDDAADTIDSSGIGLKSCRRLMEKQQGEFRSETKGQEFAAELLLPFFT